MPEMLLILGVGILVLVRIARMAQKFEKKYHKPDIGLYDLHDGVSPELKAYFCRLRASDRRSNRSEGPA
ncbi:hypothetical protein K8R32_05340 [bacterium]|nr:hypothetical protein [bacterium]